MTGCVQWRFSFEEPADAFFMAPVVGGEDVRLDGRQVDDILPMNRFGIMKPSERPCFNKGTYPPERRTASRTLIQSSPSYR